MITGLTMTESTLGARVKLNDECLSIYKRPEEEAWRGIEFHNAIGLQSYSGKSNKPKGKLAGSSSKSGKHVLKSSKESSKVENTPTKASNLNEGLSRLTLDDRDSLNQSEPFSILLKKHCPMLNNEGAGRSAHITLKTANGVESRQTNFDILQVCDLEHKAEDTESQFVFHPVQNGHICYLGDGICCVYFNEPLVLKAVFSGYY